MAQWTQTLEPYIKVQEEIKTTTLTPTAGEDLIIGVALISDAGPSTPTLIPGQKEFLKTYASQDLTQEYIDSLNNLYSGEDSTTAATMWANAYRLAGSNTLLVTRATKADNIFFSKPLTKDDQNTYILRDGELLKKIDSGFKLVLDDGGDAADHDTDGWSINISGVGIFGNRTTDEGAQYDYFVNTLPDLVEALNETTKFFSPKYVFFKNVEDSNEYIAGDQNSVYNVDMDSLSSKSNAKVVIFEEVYLGYEILDKTDPRTAPALQEAVEVDTLPKADATMVGKIYLQTSDMKYYICREVEESVYEFVMIQENMGLMYLVTCQVDGSSENMPQKVIDLNGPGYSSFTPCDYYATNIYNSATELKVRIRRFNHDAVTSKSITDTSNLTIKSNSPYTVLTSVLDTFTQNGLREPSETILERDFFEVAVWDPSINSEVSFFNIGKLLGRGDMEVSELNELLSMIQLNLPDDLHDLGLNYYGYKNDDYAWVADKNNTSQIPDSGVVDTYDDLLALIDIVPGTTKYVNNLGWFKYVENGEHQIFADLTIDPTETDLIKVSDSDLKKALDLIALDEVYTTEGLCDLGNTELSYQNYMANMAINDNYFYPISTVNSTNYMTIGNSSKKIAQESCKLYMSAPWDIDTGNLGWKYYASPSVLYWEAVARNRRNNNEFASIFGQSTGVVAYQRPVVEFNKKTRQLLLSRKINTALWNISTQAWNMNDSYTKQSENNILGEDGNSRLQIRISKAIPILLKQFIGKKITAKLCEQVRFVIDYYIKTVILPMNYTIEAYNIICNYDEILARQNKIKVKVQSRFMRSLKFVDVYNEAYDVGMSFETE